MSRQFSRDYYLDVLRGTISTQSMVLILGHMATLTTTRVTITPTSTTQAINQSAIKTTPATVKVASTSTNDTSAGTGLKTMTLIGLDSSNAVQSETITMTGQTAVTSANTYSAITGWSGLTWGSGTSNVGTVWVGSGTFTAGVPAVRFFAGEIGSNQGNTSYYAVPAGKTLYVRKLTLSVATASKACQFYLEKSSNATNWFTKAIFDVATGQFHSDIIAVGGIAAGSHVRLRGISSASTTDVVAAMSCILIDN